VRQGRHQEEAEPAAVRTAVGGIVEAPRFDDWLLEMPDHVLVQVVAPLEMLAFQFYVTPPQERLLLRAARVVWDAVDGLLPDCPADMAERFAALGAAVAVPAGK